MTSPKVPPDAKTFESMIFRMNGIGGEPRSTVLITHLYTEYLLDWILRRKIKKPDKILKRPFASKLELIESLDTLYPKLMDDLWIVNDIRNQFAHNIDIESPDFEKEFRNKIKQMNFYKDQPNLAQTPTYNTYNLIMMRIYHLLKDHFDRLPAPETEQKEV
ncbi:MAG: hypothetical protein ACYC6W_03140 [Nitrosotalea sp.]